MQLSTLKYELENIKQERELEALRHEKETRELQLKADADFRKAQVRRYKILFFHKVKLTKVTAGCRVFE